MYESESGDIEIALTGESLITRGLRGFREPAFVAVADLLRAADVTFTDAEMLFHDYEATPCEESPGTHMRADPALVDDLKWFGIDIAACAMNHAYDYTSVGVRINRANLESRAIVTAGTGDSLSLARAPGYFDCAQGRVGLVSATDHINVPGGRAADGRPGVRSRPGANVVGVQTVYTVDDATFESLSAIDEELGFTADRENARNGRFPVGRWPEGDDDLYFGPRPGGHTLLFRRGESMGRTTRVDAGDWSANLGQIREARAIADWVIFSLHCGFNGDSADDPPDHFVQMAHEAVDAGADIVVGHGTHRDKGIELYEGKPVFYGLGDFIMQNDTVRFLPDDAFRRYGLGPQAGPSEFYQRRSRGETVGQDVDPACWQTVVVTMSWRRKKLTEIRLHPVHLGMGLPVAQRGRPVVADEQASGEILDRLERCSRRFGIAIAREGGIGIVRPAQNLARSKGQLAMRPAGGENIWRGWPMAKYSRNDAKDYAREKMQGIYHAFCLPELSEGGLDEKGLRRDIRHYIDVLGAGGLYVHGFYGNFWLLTSAERRQVMEIVADETRGKVPIICRCAHQSLEESIALIKHAESAGADFISLLGPAFGGASESVIIDYFEAVSASTNLGISIFNTPQAGYVISPEMMARLGRIPNVVALKNDVTMAHTVRVRQLAGADIIVVDPAEENFLVSLTQFGQRLIYTGTGYMFDSAISTPMRDYTQAALEGDYVTAAKKYFDLQPVRDLHHRWILDPWSSTGLCPISTIKIWTQHLGLTGGKVRAPLPSLPDEQAAQLVRELDQAGLRSRTAV